MAPGKRSKLSRLDRTSPGSLDPATGGGQEKVFFVTGNTGQNEDSCPRWRINEGTPAACNSQTPALTEIAATISCLEAHREKKHPVRPDQHGRVRHRDG